MLKRAAQRADETIPWCVSPWRVDILKLPPASEAALAEATEAHLILLALRRVQSILPGLVDWLEQSALRRRIPEAALAVWGGGSAETLPARAATTFMPLACRHGLRLILDEEHARTEGAPSGDVCECPRKTSGFIASSPAFRWCGAEGMKRQIPALGDERHPALPSRAFTTAAAACQRSHRTSYQRRSGS